MFMKVTKAVSLCFVLAFACLFLLIPLSGEAKPRKGQTEPKTTKAPADPNVLTVEAKAAVLAEVSTATRLFEQNPRLSIEPASFTKVLTLFLVFDALQRGQIQLHDEVFISEAAWRTGGSKMFVGVGTRVPLEELIKGIAVLSGNDACIAVAEHISGSVGAFVAEMNRKAQELGMTQSVFLNPHGLPAEGQITTAGDMATLAIAYLKRFPQALQYHSMQEYTYNGITQYNRNHLLHKDSTVDGLKTGFVDAAGYHLTATANRDGMRLVAVVMGTPRPAVREREAAKMLAFGYRRYTNVSPFKADEPVTRTKVKYGAVNELPAYAVEPAQALVLQSAKNSVKWNVEIPPEVVAPITANQVIGKITFSIGDTPSRSIDLVSRDPVAEAGWLKKIWQGLTQIRTWNWMYIGVGAAALALMGTVVLLVLRLPNRTKTFKKQRMKRY
ncbi:MAG TPA: serine-type D-Ala-D-Ala carboxypeptidase [Syntrophobacteraceae bacterium]|nr:serine-type D-Ala-D-Ala carboxypeptidase [Syntrophobacteraceae bacterium]